MAIPKHFMSQNGFEQQNNLKNENGIYSLYFKISLSKEMNLIENLNYKLKVSMPMSVIETVKI